MGGLSSAVQWWEEWQLRVLVLSSLGLQYLLAIFAGGRRFPVPRWYRFLIWLCYLGSDALAIYSLATLFNRQRNQQYKFSQGSRDLEVLWAPILLMHLGGQVFITAYNIEDNELWSRHIVTAISQITVALYVFGKSWSPSADRRLLTTAILVFILGIIKCIEKSLALKGASFNSLAKDSQSVQRTSTKNREEELEKYVKEARVFLLADPPPPTLSLEVVKMEQLRVPDKLFVDFAYPYHDRVTSLKCFFVLHNQTACRLLRHGLSNIFDLLYTKLDAAGPIVNKSSWSCYAITWNVTIVLSIVAISLFHSSHKKSYSSTDVCVSLVLLYGTFLLDIFSLFAVAILSAYSKYHGHDVVAQHSLVGFFAGKKMDSCQSLEDITEIIGAYVRHGWKEYITDAESYKKFNDMRGQWKLEREGCGERMGWSLEKPFDESVLLWHMATDFCFHHMGTSSDDECASRSREISNYMMHLLFDNPEMLMTGSRRNLFKTACKQLRHILKGEDTLFPITKMLFEKPPPRVRRNLFKTACKQLRHILKGEDTHFLDREMLMTGSRRSNCGFLIKAKIPLDEKKLTLKITAEVSIKEGSEESFIRDAWELAEGLMKIPGDERKIWEVIQGVWVEMICFSASRCRGYLHAKSLGSGVEYLSYVWLLLAHSGMETLPERLQRPQKLQLSKEKAKHCQNGGEDAATPPAPHGEEPPKEQEIVASPPTANTTELRKEEETTANSSACQGERTVPGLEIVVSQ